MTEIEVFRSQARAAHPVLRTNTAGITHGRAPPTAGFGDSVAELLTFVFFHQAYHAGQTGVLRRLAGREGAVK